MPKITLRPLVLTSLILAAAVSRIVPHMPNFSPLNAIALLGGFALAERIFPRLRAPAWTGES